MASNRWSAVRWSIDPQTGYLRVRARRNDRVRSFEFPPLSILLIDLPRSLGDETEALEILEVRYQPKSVHRVGPTLYKVIVPTGFNPEPIGKSFIVLPLNVPNLLEAYGFTFQQIFNEAGQAVTGIPTPPRTLLSVQSEGGILYTFVGSPSLLETSDLSGPREEADLEVTWGQGALDLQRFVRLTYPYLSSFELEDVAHHLIGSIEHPKTLEDRLMLLRDLWVIFQPIFLHITTTCGVPYEAVGTGLEVQSAFSRLAPQLLIQTNFDPERASVYIDRGRHRSVSLAETTTFEIEALVRSEDPETQRLGNALRETPYHWLVHPFYISSQLHPKKIPLLDSGNVFGLYQGFVYAEGEIPNTVTTFDEMFVLATGNWIGRRPDGLWTFIGISPVTAPRERGIRRAVEAYLTSVLGGSKPEVAELVSRLEFETGDFSPEADLKTIAKEIFRVLSRLSEITE